MYLFGGYEMVPDAPYIASYGEETYQWLYGGQDDEREEEEDDALQD